MIISVQRFQADKYAAVDATVIFVPQDEAIFKSQTEQIKQIWEPTATAFSTEDFVGAKDSSIVIYTGAAKSPRLIVIGIGETSGLTLERLRRAAAAAGQRAQA